MLSESIDSYERALDACVATRDQLSSGIAQSLKGSLGSLRRMAASCEAARKGAREIGERRQNAAKRRAEVMARVSHIVDFGRATGQPRAASPRAASRPQRRPISPRERRDPAAPHLAHAPESRPNPSNLNQASARGSGQGPRQGGKPVAMTDRDKEASAAFDVQFRSAEEMERALASAETVVKTSNSAIASLGNVRIADAKIARLRVVTQSDLRRTGDALSSAERVCSLAANAVKAGESATEILAATSRETQFLIGKINKLKSVAAGFNKRWHGLSSKCKRAMARIDAAFATTDNVASSVSPLQGRLAALQAEAKRQAQKWSAEVAARRSAFASATAAYAERDGLFSQRARHISEAAKALAALSGKSAGSLVASSKSEDGRSVSALARGVDGNAIASSAISAARRKIAECAAKVRGGQKPIADLAPGDANMTMAYPRHVVVANARTSALGGELGIPLTLAFPFVKPIFFGSRGDITSAIVRILYAMPAGKVAVTAIDHAEMGANAGVLNALCGDDGIMRLVTGSRDISPVLREFDETMGHMARDVFSYRAGDWATYNANANAAPLPLRLVAVYSAKGMQESDLALLFKLMRNGPKFGMICLLPESIGEDLDDSRQRGRFEASLREIDADLVPAGGARLQAHQVLGLGVVADTAPAQKLGALAEAFAQKVSEANVKPAREITFAKLFESFEGIWEASSAEGLSAPVGWDAQTGETMDFELGVGRSASAYHALVGGTTGSGKSVFLHTMIQSLAAKYSPEELEFYLLDYKKGDEFKKYADTDGEAWLPHAKMISRHKDPRFALELFGFLDREFKRRSDMFGSYGDIVAFRRNGGKVPRIVVVIDEFQVMFEEYGGLNLSDEIAKRISTVFKQGRSYGVHMVLATQSLASLHFSGMSGVMGQIGLRIALKGTATDGILADGNRAAENIIPKRQCVINPNMGMKDSDGVVNNIVTDTPFSDPAQVRECVQLRRLMEATGRRKGYRASCRVFNGAALPAEPPDSVFKSAVAPSADRWKIHLTLLAGARTDFASTPFAVSFFDEQREHLLVAGEDGGFSDDFEVKISGEGIWNGLRRGFAKSLGFMDSCAVCHYNPSERDPAPDMPGHFIRLGGMAREKELLAALKELAASKCRCRVLFVENFQEARMLHPGDAPRPSFSSRPAAPAVPETPGSIFASAFNGTGEPPFHVVLMTKNFSFMGKEVLSRSGAEANILKGCGKRIAFNLSDDDLATMVPHLKSQDRRGPRRVWFEDLRTGTVTDFLPYGNQ